MEQGGGERQSDGHDVMMTARPSRRCHWTWASCEWERGRTQRDGPWTKIIP